MSMQIEKLESKKNYKILRALRNFRWQRNRVDISQLLFLQWSLH